MQSEDGLKPGVKQHGKEVTEILAGVSEGTENKYLANITITETKIGC